MSNNNIITPHGMLFKVMIVGQSGVGKSSILKQYSDHVFDESLLKTIGVDFNVKVINNQGVLYKMQIWDTAGQDRFRNITYSYFRGSHGMLLVFDLTNKQSLNLLSKRLTEIRNFASQTIPIILVGNKCQSHQLIKISKQQISLYCSNNNLTYVQTSAKYRLARLMIFYRNNSQANKSNLKNYQQYEEKLFNKEIKHSFILSRLPLVLLIILIVISFILKI